MNHMNFHLDTLRNELKKIQSIDMIVRTFICITDNKSHNSMNLVINGGDNLPEVTFRVYFKINKVESNSNGKEKIELIDCDVYDYIIFKCFEYWGMNLEYLVLQNQK